MAARVLFSPVTPSRHSPTTSPRQEKDDALATARPTLRDKRSKTDSTVQLNMSTATDGAGPMLIPRAPRSGDPQSNRDYFTTRRRPRKFSAAPSPESHDPSSIPPAVAALLAVTAIPPPNLRKSSKASRGASARHVSLVSISGEAVEKEFSMSPSPMDVLLSPPEDEMHAEAMERQPSMASIASTESVPSLADDDESMASAYTPPAIATRRGASERRARPPTTDTSEDHPLIPEAVETSSSSTPLPASGSTSLTSSPAPSLYPTHIPPLSRLRSNLTRALSKLSTLSTLINPSIPPDDLLTRAILTPHRPYSDEPHPRQLHLSTTSPSPSTRRYLNPPSTSFPISSSHLASALFPPLPLSPEPAITANIQLQTYIPARRYPWPAPPPRPSSPGPAAAAANPSGMLSQRQERCNSDFLRRYCVLKQMRDRGVLRADRPLKVVLSYPPRKDGEREREKEKVGVGGVPRRWVPLRVEDDEEAEEGGGRKRWEREGRS